MTVLSFSADALFTLRVIKSHIANPDNKWANSYEFKSRAGGNEGDLLDLAERVVNFEIAIHLNLINFERMIISTWEPDSVPYDPNAFISSSLTGVGARGFIGDPLPLNECLSVTRQAGSGRFGHLFYRGVLLEDQVAAPAGKATLNDRPAIQGIIDDAGDVSLFHGDYDPGAAGPFALVLINKAGTNVREVINLRAQGVSAVKQDHKWFNRTHP
jgi:hypothetical protein